MKITFEDNSGLTLKQLERATAKALETMGEVAESYTKAETPVDTGRLRNSMSHAVKGHDAYIGTNVYYAPFVENGTSRQKAHHMLLHAATRQSDEYKAILEAALESEKD